MRTLIAVSVMVAMSACEDERPLRREKQIDAASFRRTLQCASRRTTPPPDCESSREAAHLIEQIRIVPTGPSSARYEILLKNTGVPNVVYAEFPGQITNEITNAEIPYSVKAR